MANKRQKKKKNSQAAKQAAAAYKGKNAVAKPAAVKKPEQPKPVPAPEKKPEPKPQNKPQPAKQQQVEKQQTAKPKKQQKKKPVKKQKTFKEIKFQIKKKFASVDPKKGSTVILAVCIVLAVISVGALILSLRFTVPSEAKVKYMGVNVDDSEALVVTDDLATQYEFTDRMKRKGDTDEFRYYAETEITFVEKYLPAKLNLVNVFDNECVLIASIVDEAGNVVYQSLGLPAGRRLADITINSMPYGTHETKLVVAAYDPESYKLIGVQYSDLTVQIGIEEEVTDEKTQER